MLTIAKWLFGKLFAIFSIIIVITVVYFLQNAASNWLQKQETRTIDAQKLYEEAKDRAGPQYTDLREKGDALQREIVEHSQKISEATAALKELSENWKGFQAFWLPGGYSPEDYFAEQERHRSAKDRAASAKAKVEKQWAEINEKTEALRSTLLNEEEIRDAEDNAEREQEELDGRNQTITDFKNDAQDSWADAKKAIFYTIVIFLFGPIVWKTFCYWVVGGFAGKFRYLHLNKDVLDIPASVSVGESSPALKIPLMGKNTLVIKERFLQASKGEVCKKTEYVWNWKYPFLSLVAGLVFLTKVRVLDEKGEGKITLSCDDDPAIEVIRVDLMKGQEMVLRPGFLVGYLFTNETLKIRTIWNFGLQSWMTLKFRNFLIEGEGAIFLSAGRGFNDEKVTSILTIDRDIPVLWNPGLGFKARRAETFWSYALDRNSLFDDEFRGEGRVLCQQVRGFGGGSNAESIWSRFFTMIGKIFGL